MKLVRLNICKWPAIIRRIIRRFASDGSQDFSQVLTVSRFFPTTLPNDLRATTATGSRSGSRGVSRGSGPNYSRKNDRTIEGNKCRHRCEVARSAAKSASSGKTVYNDIGRGVDFFAAESSASGGPLRYRYRGR